MSSSYLVLARKYRPKTFGDLIGQRQVTHTLSRAMEVGRLAHAYLFTGPRGVGKTTAARLLAMALSCVGEPPRPCGACQFCQEIQNGQSVDVIEIDGATNRGIEEIRGIRESVRYLPVKNPKKVFIIDEVHALTKDAFNALLKTLEEPPSHVVFIFATTEAHKLPATFLSRCQRYDFRRIRIDDIVARLARVAELENIPAQKDALVILARQAEGGLRDALGLLDQVIASSGDITVESVNDSLGLINQELVFRLVLASLNGDMKDGLAALDMAYDLGYDFKDLSLRLLELVRTLTLYKAAPEAAESLDLTDDETSQYKKITSGQTLATLHRHLENWLRFNGELSRHAQPRWLMESYLIRLCQIPSLTELGPLTARLLEFLESGGAKSAQSPGPPARSLDTPIAQASAITAQATGPPGPEPQAGGTSPQNQPGQYPEPALAKPNAGPASLPGPEPQARGTSPGYPPRDEPANQPLTLPAKPGQDDRQTSYGADHGQSGYGQTSPPKASPSWPGGLTETREKLPLGLNPETQDGLSKFFPKPMPSDDSGNPIWATNNPNNPTVYSAIPDRPHGFVFDNPRTTKDKIENLKKQPVIVDLMGSLPGRFIGYRTPSPADLAKAVAEKEKQKESHEGTVYQSDDETNDGLFLDDFPVTSQEEEMD